jgi:glutamate---cysteine ligase / carboxylate-amine ligase
MNTGLMASRPTLFEALPTAGMPYLVKNWKEFQRLIQFLKRSESIQSLRDLWWDLRPSASLGTLELRVCDGLATEQERSGVVAFIHLLAMWFQDHQEEWVKTHTHIKRWIFRENKWRAIRYGLDATHIISLHGHTNYLKDDILEWVERLKPLAKKTKSANYLSIIPTIIERGGSSQRQRKIFEHTNDLHEVVKNNVLEWKTDKPTWN